MPSTRTLGFGVPISLLGPVPLAGLGMRVQAADLRLRPVTVAFRLGLLFERRGLRMRAASI